MSRPGRPFAPGRAALALCFILLTAAAPPLSRAQNYRPFDSVLAEIERTARWEIGRFRISSVFQLRNLGYDSNIYLRPDDVEPVSDYTAVIALPTVVSLNYKDWILFTLSETPAYSFYAKQEKERSFDNRVVPELRVRIFRGLVFTGSYEHDLSRRRASSEFDVRARVIVDDYRGGVFIETPRATAFGFSGSARTIRYEDVYSAEDDFAISRRLNRKEIETGLEFAYRIFSDTALSLYAGYQEYNFEYPDSRHRDSYSYLINSTVRFPLMGRLRGNISLGYKKLVPRTRSYGGYAGVVGNTFFDYRISRFILRVFYRRDFVFTFWERALFFIEGLAGPGVSYYPTSFIRLDYDFRYGESSYVGRIQSLPLDTDTGLRVDRYRTHTASVVFRVVRNIGTGLTATYWERESTVPQYNRHRFFVGALFTYEF